MAGVDGDGGGWIIDLDIQSFFDDVDWGHLRRFLDQRVRVGVIRRVIGKWLNAGAMESGEVYHPDRGAPQGVTTPTMGSRVMRERSPVFSTRFGGCGASGSIAVAGMLG